MQEVLNKIADIVVLWETGAYTDLNAMHRVLTSNMYYLAEYQVKARQDWLNHYYNSKQKTNAGKERDADIAVPELYVCRKLYDAAKGVSISISEQLK